MIRSLCSIALAALLGACIAGCASAPATATSPSASVTSQPAKAIAPQRVTDAIAIGKSTKSDVLATLGETLVIRFDTGYEVWVYRLADGQSARGGSVQPARRRVPDSATAERSGELVILFAPSGVVAKTRVRSASAR